MLFDFELLHHLPVRVFRKRNEFIESLADGRTLSRMLGELGPGFVEAGRIAASRSDVVPQPYQNALLNNTSALPVMGEKKFTHLLKKSIGTSAVKEIGSIELDPYRSNLISQTNKAILKDGRRVLITVNDPKSVRLMGDTVETLQELLPAIASKFKNVIAESMLYELVRRAEMLSDLALAGSRAEMLDAHFEHHQKITIPEVLWEYTNRDVLVQRWHNHPTMREIAEGRKKTAAARKYINRYTAEAFIYQYGVGGVFVLRPLLSDMQIGPRNSVIMNHVLGTGYLEPEERRVFVALLYALLEGKPELAAKVLLKAHYGRHEHRRTYFSSGIHLPESRKASISELVWELLEQAWHGNMHVPLGISMAAESVLYLEHAFTRLDSDSFVLNDNLLLAIKKYTPEIFGLKKTASVAEIVTLVTADS